MALGVWVAVAPGLIGLVEPRTLGSARLVLALLPAIAAVVGGLGMLAERRGTVSVAGVLALGAGLWLVARSVGGALTAGDAVPPFGNAGAPTLQPAGVSIGSFPTSVTLSRADGIVHTWTS